MSNRLCLTGSERYGLGVRLLLEGFLALASGVTLRHVLPVLRLVVQRLEVQCTVCLPRTLTGDSIAQIVLLR